MALASSQRHGGGESGASGEYTRGEYIEGGWVRSGSILPSSRRVWGFLYPRKLRRINIVDCGETISVVTTSWRFSTSSMMVDISRVLS